MPKRIVQTVQIDSDLQWAVAQLDEDQEYRWIGICEALRLTVEAPSFPELMGEIGEVLNAVFVDLYEEGRFHSFLTRHGWTVTGGVVPEPERDIQFEVPFYTTRGTASDLNAVTN